MGTLQRLSVLQSGRWAEDMQRLQKDGREPPYKNDGKIADTDCRMRLSTKPAILLESAIMDLMLPEAQETKRWHCELRSWKSRLHLEQQQHGPATPPRMSVDTPPEKPVPKAAAQKKAGAGKDTAGLLEGLKNAMAKNLLYGDIVNALEISSLSGNKITFYVRK